MVPIPYSKNPVFYVLEILPNIDLGQFDQQFCWYDLGLHFAKIYVPIFRIFKVNFVTGISKCITLKCLKIGTPKTINFPFVPNGKLMILSVPVFKHNVMRL